MGWSSMLYDIRNLPTASQDPKLLSEGKWLCSLYDDYGRATNSGFYNANTSSPPDGNTPVIHDLLNTTIYDYDCGQTDAQYRGKVCQSRTRILNSNNWLETNLTYDEFGRTSATNGNSHANLIIGSEQNTFTYDWADNLLTTTRSHQAFNQSQLIVDRLTYDHVGRIENIYQRVNGGAEERLANQDYSVKDELITKKIGGVGNNFLQQVDYAYKANGFLENINKVMSSDDLFQMDINYEIGNTAWGANGQKNGNISELAWQVKGQTKQAYGYQYDFLNRLTVATFGQDGIPSANGNYSTTYTYDSRGNIETLQRQGYLPDGSFAEIDNLDYDYIDNGNSSNRMEAIADNAPMASKTEGFKSGIGGTYGYDANGNMNYDLHKDMNIRYNHLNLPEFIKFPDCKAIEYTYDAGGTKLAKTTKNGNAVIVTQDYVGGIEYKNGVIEAIYNGEGRLYFEGGNNRYEYNLKDHLGNSRVCFTDKDGNGVIDITGNPETNEVLEESHFYPFGMQMQGSFTQNAGRENKYLYNGKELQDDFGLGWYDYGARFYDPAIARWNAVDPLGELTPSWTPFRYGFNNPIFFTDPTGMAEEAEATDGYGVVSQTSGSYWSSAPRDKNGGDDPKPTLAEQYPSLFGNTDKAPGTFFMQLDMRLTAPLPGLKMFKEIPIGLTGGSAAGLAIDGNSIALFASLSFGASAGVGFTTGFSGGFFPSATVDELMGGGFSAGAWAKIGDLVSLRGFSIDVSILNNGGTINDLRLGGTVELKGFTWGAGAHLEGTQTVPIWGPHKITKLQMAGQELQALSNIFKTSLSDTQNKVLTAIAIQRHLSRTHQRKSGNN